MRIFSQKFGFKKENGYTLLFAVLTASLVLGVAVFILSISRGQYLLASTARESTFAIYAADSGIECAANSASTVSTSSSNGSVTCAGQSPLTVTFSSAMQSSFDNNTLFNVYQSDPIYMNLGDGRCVQMTFVKGFSGSGGTGDLVTRIESRGYNFCTGTGPAARPDTSNPKIVERAIRLTYVGM